MVKTAKTILTDTEKNRFQSRILNVEMSRVLFYCALTVFKLLLDFSYTTIIFPMYQYMGFVLVNDGMKVFAGLVLFALMLFFIPYKIDKPSSILSLCLFVITYIPTLTIFSYGDASYSFIFANTVFFIVMLTAIKLLPQIRFKQPGKKLCKAIFLSVVFLICLYCCFFVIKTFGFNIKLSISGAYTQREEYKAASIPLSSYLFTWSSNVILPMGFMYLFIKKRYILMFVPIISQLLLYSATGMKSMLFTIPIVILFAAMLRFKNVSLYLIVGLAAASVFCIAAYSIFDQIMPISLLLRRVFLVPARISQYYFEFFDSAGQIRLSHSIFESLSNYRFEAEPAKFISKIFVGSESNFNSGIVADGFANFGYIGVLCWSIFTAIVFKLMDSMSIGKNRAVAVSGIIMFISSLSNSALITNLGTHGIMAAIFMLYILPAEDDREEKINDSLHNDKCSSP